MRAKASWGALCGALALGCDAARVPRPPPHVVTLLHTADIHSRLWPFRARISSFEAELGLGRALALEEVGGVARLATLLALERQRAPALWLDSGDALEGAPVFQREGGRLELQLLSALGLSGMALGNHELSLSSAQLGDLLRSSARFPVLAANLRVGGDSPLRGWLLPSELVELGGLNLGVVGVANQQSPPNLAQPNNPWGLAVSADLALSVQQAVDDIAPRAALVIVLSHLGLEADRELLRRTTGVAAVLGGHQHIVSAEPEWQDDCVAAEVQAERGCSPRRVPIVHSGAYGQWLSRLELTLAPAFGGPSALEVVAAALTQLPVAAQVPQEPQVSRYLQAQAAPVEPPLAFLPHPMPRRSALGGDSALGNLSADAVLRDVQADATLLNSSGLREDLEAGVLLRSDLELAFPFAEPWRLAWLRGRALRQGLMRAAVRSAGRDCATTLQVAGLRLKMRCGACRAQTAACLEVTRDRLPGGGPLRDDDWLLVALPAYLTLAGADFEDAASGAEVEVSVPGALARSFAELPRLSAPDRCAAQLASWSAARCAEAFGVVACSSDSAQAQAICAALPLVEGAGDGRIEMLP